MFPPKAADTTVPLANTWKGGTPSETTMAEPTGFGRPCAQRQVAGFLESSKQTNPSHSSGEGLESAKGMVFGRLRSHQRGQPYPP